MIKKIVYFPNDPIEVYCKKGEIKPRYFNPDNFFDEVHLVSLCKKDVDPSLVQEMAGNAKFFIHSVGNPISVKEAWRLPMFFGKIIRLVKEIDPQVVRGYNSVFNGFLAVYVGKKLRIPSIVSLHNDEDEVRLENNGLISAIYHLFCKYFIEPYSMKHANLVMPVSRFLSKYAIKYGAKNIKVIYNRVYASQFARPENYVKQSKYFTILTVGRLSPLKNLECIIRAFAISKLDARLVFIGSGPKKEELKNLAKQLGILEKCIFIPSVKYAQIQNCYWEADIFTMSSIREGLPNPIIEAMTAGLCIVALDKEPFPELIEDCGILAKNEEEFAFAFKKLFHDASLRLELGKKAFECSQKIEGKVMERKEAEMYQEVLKMKV